MDIYGKYDAGGEVIHIENVDEPPSLIHCDTGIEIRLDPFCVSTGRSGDTIYYKIERQH